MTYAHFTTSGTGSLGRDDDLRRHAAVARDVGKGIAPVSQVATTLANHAIALLALGMLAMVLALGAVAGVVYLVLRHDHLLRPVWTRFRPWIPARHVMVHVALGFVTTIALVAVAILAGQITPDSAIVRFDTAFAKALDANTTPAWRRFFQVVTLMGTGTVLGVASAVVGVFLLVRRHLTLAIGWGVAQVGAVVLVKAIKATVERTRPGLGDPSFFASGWSFPSGHVVRTFAFGVMGAYLVLRLTRSWRSTVVVCALAGLCTLVMAFSRMYLGAHFASDVTAGFIAATAWVAVCISATEEVLRRGQSVSPGSQV